MPRTELDRCGRPCWTHAPRSHPVSGGVWPSEVIKLGPGQRRPKRHHHPPGAAACGLSELLPAAASRPTFTQGGGTAPSCPGAPAPPLRPETAVAWSAPWPDGVENACSPCRAAWGVGADVRSLPRRQSTVTCPSRRTPRHQAACWPSRSSADTDFGAPERRGARRTPQPLSSGRRRQPRWMAAAAAALRCG